MKRLLPLILILTACANTPTADPRVQAAAMNESERLDAIAATQQQEAYDRAFNHSQTETALPFASTAMAQQSALTQIYVDGKAADAVATQTYRVTEAAYSAIIIPTKIAAVGTELARESEKQKADVAAAQSRRDMWSGAPLAALIMVVLFVAWIASLIYTNHKKRNNIAQAKPEVVGGRLVLPPGYTSHPIIASAPYMPALPAPPAIENRAIPINGGQAALSVSYPVNDHEREWRTALVQAAMIFQDKGMASPSLCGKGKPFASASHWQDITDRLADNGLLIKDNGAPTLAAGKWGDIISRLQDANKPLRLPASRPPRLRVFSLQNSV